LTPEDQYRARFQNEIVGNAQQLLQANRQRLANEQAKYSQNTNPNSPHWQQLWQMAGKRREFAQKERNLQAERDRISLERQHISAIPSLTDGMGATPEQIRNSPKHKQLVKLSEQQQKIEAQIEQAKQMQVSLEYAYPALAAINNETGTKPGDIQAVLQRMPGKFSDIRANIDKLSEQLQKDPGTATLFDSVVAAQLQQWQQDKSIPPEQRKQVMEWLKKERENKDRNAKIGAFASGGLFVASFIPQLRGISMGLRLAGVGVGGAVAASEIPDLIMLDAAAQAGRGGAGKLTSQSPDEARFNLVMGYANVALAGLDAGLEVGVVQKLAKSTMSLASSGAQITRQQWSRLIEFAKQGASGGEQARALLASIKNLPKQAADEIWRAIDRVIPQPELAGVPNSAIDPKQPMQSTGSGRSSGRTTTPNPNVSPEIAAKWSKTKNWKDVEPFIGKQAGDKPPPGYEYAYYKETGVTVVRRKKGLANNEAMVPIQIGDDGTFQVTTRVSQRLSRPGVMKRNFETAFGQLKNGYWIHHLIPDEVVRKNALTKIARQHGYDLDNSSNLLGMADKEQWSKIQTGQIKGIAGNGYSDKVGHWSSHDQYSRQVNQYLNDQSKRLKNKFGDLETALKDPKKKKQLIQEIKQTMKEAEEHFRTLVEQGNVPQKNGRIAWNNEQIEPTA
jgi:hypothetical protein